MPNVPNLDYIEETVQDARKCTENIVDIIQEPFDVLTTKLIQTSLWKKRFSWETYLDKLYYYNHGLREGKEVML